ncbi:LRR domain containing protein [Trema orientale]|uniref:LRR domain containing protein n=1 Tax=Trema orientale TaxID=63057 RepID=A0A2P5B8R3_TREOI|nr:LRR domain containing protein [Trema orientale]
MVCSNGGFPQLKSLSFMKLEKFKEWKVEEGALPSLYSLHIDDCSMLSNIPDGLRFVTTLKEMMIQRMPIYFKLRVEEGGEDFYKVQHVPSLIIQDDSGFNRFEESIQTIYDDAKISSNM